MSKAKAWFIAILLSLIVIATGFLCAGSNYTLGNGLKPLDIYDMVLMGYVFLTMPRELYKWIKGDEKKEK